MSIKKLRVIGHGGAASVGCRRAAGAICRSCRLAAACLTFGSLSCLPAALGCARSVAPAAASNLRLTDQERQRRLVLSDAEQERVLEAMESVAEGQAVVRRPWRGMRFSDIPAAVVAASGRIEAAIIETERMEDGFVFQLRTVEDWPGELTVRRVDGARVYEAKAWIGRFPDLPARKRRAERLVEELREEMEALGRKRRR